MKSEVESTTSPPRTGIFSTRILGYTNFHSGDSAVRIYWHDVPRTPASPGRGCGGRVPSSHVGGCRTHPEPGAVVGGLRNHQIDTCPHFDPADDSDQARVLFVAGQPAGRSRLRKGTRCGASRRRSLSCGTCCRCSLWPARPRTTGPPGPEPGLGTSPPSVTEGGVVV